MKPLTVCTQTFNRQDLLPGLIESINNSTRRADRIIIVDHGYDESRIRNVIHGTTDIPIEIITLEDPGCSHNGNWFIRNVPDDRVTCGDDIRFDPQALEIMAATPGDFIIPQHGANPCACCLIRQPVIDAIGYFDELISPGYLYFDDTDFIRRLELAGLKQVHAAGAFVHHHNGGSQTLARLTPAQMEEHHRRFQIASANYSWKWGGPPFAETLNEPRPLPRPKGWGLQSPFAAANLDNLDLTPMAKVGQ